jgi:RHS repeat-associated protein
VTGPNGATAETAWNAFDLPLSQQVVAPAGTDGPEVLRRTSFDYDERGRLLRRHLHAYVDDPSAAAILTQASWYDRDGLCVRRDGPYGAHQTSVYDGCGRIVRSDEAGAGAVLTTYGPDGLPSGVRTEETGPDGTAVRATSHVHDARGRLVRSVASTGAVTVTRYDARDLAVEQHDDTGVSAARTYGALGELARSTVDPAGLALATGYAYDALGRMTALTDPTGESTQFAYDRLGRLVRTTLADGGTHAWTFDGAGDPREYAGPDGSVLHMAHDAGGRLAALSVQPGPGRLPVPDHHFAYDGLSGLVGADASGPALTRRHDSLDRLVGETFDGSATARVFDDTTRSYRLQYPDGRSEHHAWDPLGRVVLVRLLDAGPVPPAVAGGAGDVLCEIAYRGSERVARIVQANGVRSDWVHDDEGRLVRIQHTLPAGGAIAVRYRCDHASRRRVVQGPSQTHCFDYDGRRRLTGWRAGFVLAPLGDAKTQAEQDLDIAAAAAASGAAPRSATYSLDGSDTPLLFEGVPYTLAPGHKVVGIGPRVVTYTPDGMRLGDGQRSYTYDALGRAAGIVRGGVATTYGRDPLGRIVRVQAGADSETRTWFGSAVLALSGAAGSADRTVIPHFVGPVCETRPGERIHFHANGHDDLIVATGRHGAVVERYEYAPFGAPAIFAPDGTPRAGSALAVAPVFGGMPWEAAAGLYFTPQRHYDPESGLFVARDPLPGAASPSPYVFGPFDPVNLVDPSGALAPIIVAGLVAGGIGAVIGIVSTVMRGNRDAGDIAFAGAVGLGAGFIAAVTFGEAAAFFGGPLLTSLAGAGATGTVASGTVSVGSGMAAGAASGFTSGFFTGAAYGSYARYRYGGDWSRMVLEGGLREGLADAAGGAVSGGLFKAFMRIGTPPPDAWNALREASNRTPRAAVLPGTIGRGLAGASGLGAPVAGFSGGYTSGLVRRRMQGEDFEDAAHDAITDGYWGAGASVAGTAMHPTTWVYWSSRLSVNTATGIQAARAGRAHHQLSVAQYPEYATPDLGPTPRVPLSPFARWYGRTFTSGNIQGRYSAYNGDDELHGMMHDLWRFGSGGWWSRVGTHGPWTPTRDINHVVVDPRALNDNPKD